MKKTDRTKIEKLVGKVEKRIAELEYNFLRATNEQRGDIWSEFSRLGKYRIELKQLISK